MRFLNLALVIVFIFVNTICAQVLPPGEENTREQEQIKRDEEVMRKEREKMRKEDEKMRKEMEEMQKNELEMLKKTDPEAYQERVDAIERNNKIMEIVSLYNQEQISERSASTQLYPLVEKEMEAQLESIDEQIERLEKKINYLKNCKDNPSELINKRINSYLGKASSASEEEFIW